MREAVQKAVGGVGGGPARVVAHADGEDGVLGGGDGHSGAGRDLQHDEPEPGGDGVGEAREGRFIAVAAQQLGVFDVARGQQLGLESEGHQPCGVGRVGGRDPGRRRGGCRVRRCAVVDVVLGHG
ncbi:hypothetical protein SANT12839_014380 [Streptomyces antimycoticus]|uniref:Uncharacterized protein n=1 Tax=Streptomyces antimycoticus TaxID=68175 RepID=A0A4D4K1J6_9ACTN|nr:hypothetical protein SANT12839_014380 [Streptomyces antimycoticus]